MPSNTYRDEFGEDLAEIPYRQIRNARLPSLKKPLRKGKLMPAREPITQPEPLILPDADSLSEKELTYNASRHERGWIIDSLSDFYDQQWFSDILRLIKGGKEASVYLCKTKTAIEAPLLAAKVYRPRRFRNLKKDHIYREGRDSLDENGNPIRNAGMLHAIRKKTDYGKQLNHTAWIEYEYRTLQVLHAAGADVPIPFTRGNNAILMSYIGDEELAAPTLQEVHLSQAEARRVFQRALHNIELMLDHNLIHGDLSAFNILYWQGEITLIDFPQVIHPEQNVNAYWIFLRDLTRLCEYFANYEIHRDPKRLATSLWKGHGHPIEPLADPAYLDADRQEDRQYWTQMSEESGL